MWNCCADLAYGIRRYSLLRENNMTKTTPQQAAAQDIKEVSKIMMLQSDDHSYKNVSSFPRSVAKQTSTKHDHISF